MILRKVCIILGTTAPLLFMPGHLAQLDEPAVALGQVLQVQQVEWLVLGSSHIENG